MRIFFLLAFTFSLSPPLSAQPEDLTDLLKAHLDKEKVPALAAAVIVDGQVKAIGATGLRHIKKVDQVTLNDKFHIGSCGKSMTATLAAILVKEGKIKWDSTIGETFPEQEIHENYKSVTLTQLLHHNSGCPPNPSGLTMLFLYSKETQFQNYRKRLLDAVLKESPLTPPGTKHLYSNVGYSIAGAMLEMASGIPYEELLIEKLAKPLGITTLGFGAPGNEADQPIGHAIDQGKIKPFIPNDLYGDNPPAYSPAGRMHLTIADWSKYILFHLGSHPQNGKLLTKKDRQQLYKTSKLADYSMGWVHREREWAGGLVLNHGGSNTTFRAVTWLAPNKKFATLVMSNADHLDMPKTQDIITSQLIKKYLK